MSSKQRHEAQIPLIEDLPTHSKRTNAAIRRQRLELQERADHLELDPEIVYVQTYTQLEEAAEAASLSNEITLDTETRTKRWVSGEVVSMQLYAPSTRRAYFIPVRMAHAENNFTDAQIATVFKAVLEDESVAKIGHELKYDIQFIRKSFGINVRNYHFDTLTTSRILNENEPHDLEALCVRYCKSKPWKITHSGLPFELWPIKVAIQYGATDVIEEYKLWKYQTKYLRRSQYAKLRSLCYTVEFPNVRSAVGMEQHGIGFDSEYFAGVVVPTVDQNIADTRARIFEVAGQEFDLNPNAPAQIATMLFDRLELPRIRENHVNNYVLLQLKQQGYEIADAILENRKWETLKKMFCNKLPLWVYNGRIHTTFNTTGTESGRWTSNDPNLQQIPKKIGPLIRRAFIPAPGNVFLTLDYDQGELRMLAHLSDDEGMIAAFKSGMDFHAAVLCMVFDISPEEYEAHKDEPEFVEKRTLTKNINFGTLYGMKEYTLSIRINKPKQEAKQFQDQWFARFPGARRYVNTTPRFAYDHGYVETILGRKRRLLPDIRSSDFRVAAAADREAVNMPIQGSVADLVKMTTNKHAEMITKSRWPYIPILQLHDELLYEGPQDWLEHHQHTALELKDAMENIYALRCPMAVSMETLSRWGDKKVLDYDEIEDEVKEYAKA